MIRLTRYGAAALVCMSAVAAGAQTGPAPVIQPRMSPFDLRTYASAYGSTTESDGNGGDDVDLATLDAYGWARLTPRPKVAPEADAPPARSWVLGYESRFIGVGSNDPLLPERLFDTSIAVAVDLTELDLGDWGTWQLAATLGAGHASDEPFDDQDGWYGKASVVAFRQLDPQSFLFVSLFYDGNASVFPDIPLPGFLYQTQLNDEVAVQLGFPFAGFVWTPDDQWTIGMRYLLPIDLTLDVEYRLSDQWAFFGRIYSDFTAVDEADSDSNDRLFFLERRAELGARWQALDNLDLELAAGYAFAQEFERGWDLRDTDTVRELDDAPFARVGLTWRY